MNLRLHRILEVTIEKRRDPLGQFSAEVHLLGEGCHSNWLGQLPDGKTFQLGLIMQVSLPDKADPESLVLTALAQDAEVTNDELKDWKRQLEAGSWVKHPEGRPWWDLAAWRRG